MQVQLFNTQSREKELFTPQQDNKVGIYSCGPTVYARAHLGNMRAYLFADLLRRVMEFAGYDVTHVMNITDVGHLTDDGDDGDDKLMVGAAKEKITAWELARRYEDQFFDDSAQLGIRRPSVVCRATDHIKQQIEMVQTLEERGFTYRTEDGIYFDTEKYPQYGEMAKLDIEGLRAGERIDLGGKKSKTDFALWKFSPTDSQRDMEWESPWGKGFPGWHIECSAMATHYLGEIVDIHTGGTDHIPIHHTNEIAQSECAHDSHPFVRYWMHCQFLVFPGGEKISKSSGHDLSVDGLKAMHLDPLAYRYLALTAHYRSFLNYTEEAILSAGKSLGRLRAACQKAGYTAVQASTLDGEALMAKHEDIFAPLLDDLHSAKALAAFWNLLKDESIDNSEKLPVIAALDALFGLQLDKVEEDGEDDVPADVQALADARVQARKDKDWGRSDELRDQMAALGFHAEDTREGQKLSRIKG
jgi:cysteinyl-tRNA synthetase